MSNTVLGLVVLVGAAVLLFLLSSLFEEDRDADRTWVLGPREVIPPQTHRPMWTAPASKGINGRRRA